MNTNFFAPILQVNVETAVDSKIELDTLLSKYDNITKSDLGKIKNIQVSLRLKENVKPVFMRARMPPFKLIPLVEKELESLENEGLISKVENSEWATPVVPILKKDNTVRLCGDFSVTVNPNLVIDYYHLPSVDELFAGMSGCKIFSKIDLRQAYLQLELNNDAKKIVVLNTHKGLYQCNRMWYGIASAVGIWQRNIENLFAQIPGVKIMIDDMRIGSKTVQEHIEKLEAVFKILHEYNIKINLDKCSFFQSEITYCGYTIDQYGIHKMKAKMEAIDEMPRPKNETEVRAFVGMINYYNRFIKNVSSILKPLYELLQKNKKFVWTDECENAFITAKNEFKSDNCLTYYDPKLPLILATDASMNGCGAVLSHKMANGEEKPIKFISHTFSSVQKKYSMIDKEAFAIVFGIKKFHQYLYGNTFTLITDHRPLTQIFSQSNSLPVFSALRMQHYAVFLQSYNYNIIYRKSECNGNADCLSRLSINTDSENVDVVDEYYLDSLNTLPVTAKEIISCIKSDDKLQAIKNKLENGKSLSTKETWNCNPSEFSLEHGVLMRGHRVVIPNKLKNNVLLELHSGHFGIIKMKNLARGYCWWENIDKDIERLVSNCYECNINKNNPKKVEKHVWEPALEPFQRVHVDFAGLFLGKYFFVLIDSHTKWPEVFVVNDMTAKTVILKCEEVFTRFGYPNFLVSDNGPTFVSNEFKEYLKIHGIYHKLTAPYNPATNGQAERFIQVLKQSLRKMESESGTVQEKVQRMLVQYRIMPHSVTGKTPSEMLFHKQIRNQFDLLKPNSEKLQNNSNTQVISFQKGERVSCRNYTGKDKWMFGCVEKKLGKLHYWIKLDDGRRWKT